MKLTVLSVAYPFAPVRPATSGGAEQVLYMIDSGLIRRGHESIVLAAADSSPAGKLIRGPVVKGMIDDNKQQMVRQQYRQLIHNTLKKSHVDIIHMHGLDFETYLPDEGPPVLVTLHLPLDWYSPDALRTKRPFTFLQCVSASQMNTSPPGVRLLPSIENGVPVETFRTGISKKKFVFALGRICPEKGFHIALDAARLADIPMLLAGEVFRYEAHERYFRERYCRERMEAGSGISVQSDL
jgi:hypothetical protein